MVRTAFGFALALAFLAAPLDGDAQTVPKVARVGLMRGEVSPERQAPLDQAFRQGLISYGANREEIFRRAAIFVDKIFKGARPAELPVEQPRQFELNINLRTAKTLGLAIPPSLLQRADQVIQ